MNAKEALNHQWDSVGNEYARRKRCKEEGIEKKFSKSNRITGIFFFITMFWNFLYYGFMVKEKRLVGLGVFKFPRTAQQLLNQSSWQQPGWLFEYVNLITPPLH